MSLKRFFLENSSDCGLSDKNSPSSLRPLAFEPKLADQNGLFVYGLLTVQTISDIITKVGLNRAVPENISPKELDGHR
jgi:hypothetical protein